MPTEFDAMAAGVVRAMKDFVTRAVAGFNARLVELEAKLAALPAPRDGRDGLPGITGAKGEDGRDGSNGRDGLGFDDVAVDYDGERALCITFERDGQKKAFAFTLPLVLDRGVWREGEYSKGDGVTWAGSFWIAQRDTEAKPDAGGGEWRLAVKRGRDGKA